MNWLNLLILILLVAGHTEVQVVLVNRLHARPLHCSTLRHLRHLHDALLVLFPCALFWFLGLQGPELLAGGSWADLHPAWIPYLGICVLGMIGLIGSTVRWRTRRVPKLELSYESKTVDIAERLGGPPLGEGPFQFLTRIPGNEVFQIEVCEKEYRLPRLPRAWDRLSILHLSDLHYFGTLDRPYFEEMAKLSAEMNADLIVFTGDLLDDQRLTEWLPQTLGRLNAPLGSYFILGNHDWFLDPDQTRAVMTDLGWQDVASRTVPIEYRHHQLIIGGSEVPWMGEHPDFSTAPDEAFRLFLSHTPDHFAFARQQNVDLMLSGHNHGGQVVLPIIGPVYSPSRYGVHYASGVFWSHPTLLYASRGISGRHPLRWNCPPELTKLVLRAE